MAKKRGNGGNGGGGGGGGQKRNENRPTKEQRRAVRQTMREGWASNPPNFTDPMTGQVPWGNAGNNAPWSGYPGTAAAPPPPPPPPPGDSDDKSWVSDIDWAFTQAWPDPAVRAGLVKMIEDAVARKELDPYADQTIFLGKVWNMVRATSEYKARFPGLARLEASAGYNPSTSMTPADYMKMEGLYDNAMAYYGIPGGVFNRNEMIADLVEKQVTPAEMQTRLQMAQDAAAANADITSKLLEYEGIEPGHIIAFYLNPDDAMAAIQRKEQTLQIGGMMARYGFAGAKSDAQLWQQQFGSEYGSGQGSLSTGSVTSALDRAVAQRALMSGLGETADESTLLQGSAGENDQRARLRAIAAQREGRFNKTGGAVEGRTGVSGLGVASTT